VEKIHEFVSDKTNGPELVEDKSN